MIRDTLLATGVLFAAFTQLRLPGTPLGPGEICLFLWLAATAAGGVPGLTREMPRGVAPLAAFWVLFAVALCIGTMVAFVLDERNSKAHFVHDCVAYAMLAALSLLAVAQDDAAARLRRTAWLVVGIGSAALALMLAQAAGIFALPGVDVWYYDRLAGWSTNANQLGLMCLVVALVALHLAETEPVPAYRLVALLGFVLPLAAGIMTRSDAFALTIALSIGLLLGGRVWRFARGAISVRASTVAGFVILFAAVPTLVVGAYAVDRLLSRDALDAGSSPLALDEGLERDVGYRTELIGLALEKAAQSGFLGLGPGPHLQRPVNLREPLWDPAPNFEAHNTLLDVLLQGGIVAVGALLWLGLSALRATASARLVVLPVLLIGVAAFGLTHFILRHPLFWFVLVLALGHATSAAAHLRRQCVPSRSPSSRP